MAGSSSIRTSWRLARLPILRETSVRAQRALTPASCPPVSQVRMRAHRTSVVSSSGSSSRATRPATAAEAE
eukprot:CAMPEP_0174709292 /NCGR_PEP_ID=MMETSP1094-20130205/11302_1 /TAXON_ID=156173 /ORGANISM="Chrysochromulina brevifilum, Strain UTEX LB 985" /LENGTH=70 /DNA_ID=CAMNT_0015907955 /DNA_START=488 /DNA_END=697 /DNA_ORIENTATION=-